MDGELCYTTCCYCHGIPVAGGESFSFPFQRKEPGPNRSCAVSCSWPVTELGLEPRPLHPGKVVGEESVASVWEEQNRMEYCHFQGSFPVRLCAASHCQSQAFAPTSRKVLGLEARI